MPNDTDRIVEDIRAFFASGTNCQELYLTPSLLDARTWDALAEAATWSRNNADVLVDTHWIGGDPAKGEVYGWASWSKRKGILALRNPKDEPGQITIDIGKAFELPQGAARQYSLKSPWKDDAATEPTHAVGRRGTHLRAEAFRSPRVRRRRRSMGILPMSITGVIALAARARWPCDSWAGRPCY